MNITDYELKVTNSQKNRQIRLIYRGNENVVIYLDIIENEKPKELYIHVPRLVLEHFLRLIND